MTPAIATTLPKLGAIWLVLLACPVGAVPRGLYCARDAGARAGARRDVAQLPARLHRRALVRPCRLFRPRRLRHRPGAEAAHCRARAALLLGCAGGAVSPEHCSAR